MDPGEACDDGNNTAGDGCSAVCVIEVCGDGVEILRSLELLPRQPKKYVMMEILTRVMAVARRVCSKSAAMAL